MFRVNQSQILPQSLKGLLSQFNNETAVQTTKTKPAASEFNQIEVSFAPLKRRRRARRFTGYASTGLRSTWF